MPGSSVSRVLFAALVLLAAPRAFAQQDNQISVKARVLSFNRGPNGSAEGIVLAGPDGTFQLNMPPDLSVQLMQTVAVGDTVDVVGSLGPGGRGRGAGPGRDEPAGPDAARADGPGPDAGRAGGPGPRANATPDHPVFELVSLTDAHGKTYAHTGPGDHQRVTVDGIVSAINYNHEGAPDGLQLNTGDLIRVDPDRVPIVVNVGDHIVVVGNGRTLAGGGHLIEPITINGADVKAPPRPEGPRGDAPPPPPPPPDDPNGP